MNMFDCMTRVIQLIRVARKSATVFWQSKNWFGPPELADILHQRCEVKVRLHIVYLSAVLRCFHFVQIMQVFTCGKWQKNWTGGKVPTVKTVYIKLYIKAQTSSSPSNHVRNISLTLCLNVTNLWCHIIFFAHLQKLKYSCSQIYIDLVYSLQQLRSTDPVNFSQTEIRAPPFEPHLMELSVHWGQAQVCSCLPLLNVFSLRKPLAISDIFTMRSFITVFLLTLTDLFQLIFSCKAQLKPCSL